MDSHYKEHSTGAEETIHTNELLYRYWGAHKRVNIVLVLCGMWWFLILT